MKYLIWLIAALPLLSPADESILSGFVAGEVRGFQSDSRFEGQFNAIQSSLILQPELRGQANSSRSQFSFVPFARLDSRDTRRTHADLREAYWLQIGDQWNLLAGVNRVFWGVAESNHLIDIINQTDLIDDIDGEEKLGQPMINLATQQQWGDISFFVMPWFRERTFPSKEGRLRFPAIVSRAATYESSDEQHHVDLALRYSHYIGEWDFGIYYFRGTGREPRFSPDDSGKYLIAQYDLIDQIGTDIQLTSGAWLWKFEGIVRAQNADRFGAMTGGFEYTYFQIFDSSADTGVLLEYSYDGRDDDPAKAPPVTLDDDIFLAARLALNDTQDSELLAGIIIDRRSRSTMLSIEAERRLNSHWNLELESRWFINTNDDPTLSPLKKDSFLTLRLSRYF